MKNNLRFTAFIGFFLVFVVPPLSAQDCDCYEKENYEYVEYKGRYRTLRIPVECDSLISMEKINNFFAYGDMYYEMAGEFFGWDFLHPVSLITTTSPTIRGAGTGTGGTGMDISYFGINVNGIDNYLLASEYDLNGTIVHEGIHRWDFRGGNFFQGPDFAHPLTVGIQDYLQLRMGSIPVGLYANQTSLMTSDLEIKRRLKYFWRRYLSKPGLDWDHYFSSGFSFDTFNDVPKPEAYERLAIQGATLLQVIFMHGEEGLQNIFKTWEDMRQNDPSWDNNPSKEAILDRHIRGFGDGLQVDVSDYFDYWKYPVSQELRNYLSQYPKSEKIQDMDGDGFSPLQGDLDDNDPTLYPDAPELFDGKDNNQDGQIDEAVVSEKDSELPANGKGPLLGVPGLLQGTLSSLEDEDAFYINLPERALVTIVFTSLNSDTTIQYGDHKIAMFDGILQKDGNYHMRQDIVSGENNIHRTEYLDAGEHRFKVVGKGDDRLCPGEYEIQIFINTQGPFTVEKNGLSYTHKAYNHTSPDPNFNTNNVNGASKSEAEALKAIYNQLGGEDWQDPRGWLMTDDICYWTGLSCDRLGISLLRLDYRQSLNGPFTQSMLNGLKNMREFAINGANFQQKRLEDAFTDWRNISILELPYNNIRGPLPQSLANKSKLWRINLKGNQFNGTIPESWATNTQLKEVFIDENAISGALPSELYRWENIRSFYFDQDEICVPNQKVWNWLQTVPNVHSRDFVQCDASPSDMQMLGPLQADIDLTVSGNETINIDWTDSQDPENQEINYSWIIGAYVGEGENRKFVDIQGFSAELQSNFEIQKNILADSLENKGFGGELELFHFALASDGRWLGSTDTVAISFKAGQAICRISGQMTTSGTPCFGQALGKAEVSVNQAFGSLSYQWNTGDEAAALSFLEEGAYSVEVKDEAGCTTTIFGEVPGEILLQVEELGNTLQASIEGGQGPYSFAWSDGSHEDFAIPENDKQLSLLISDSRGCHKYFLPSPLLNPASGISEESFVLNWQEVAGAELYIIEVAEDPEFKQLIPDGSMTSDNKNWISVPLYPEINTYYFRVRAAGNNTLSAFSQTGSIDLTKADCELFVEAEIIHFLSNADRGEIALEVLGGKAPYTYSWEHGPSGENVSIPNTGTYTVNISDSQNCQAERSFVIGQRNSLSMGDKVWYDRNRNGIQDRDEKGIPNVAIGSWRDSDGDGIPDGNGWMGFVMTDETGLYKIENLVPGVYRPFVWEAMNFFEEGAPLADHLNSIGEANPNDDFNFDDNGRRGHLDNGPGYYNFASKIVHLNVGKEPTGDQDLSSSVVDMDPSSNNTIDFGFYHKDSCPDMSALISGKLLLCDENDRGSISAQAIRTVGLASYKWDTGAQGPELPNLAAGTYTVEIQDAVQCKQNQAITIQQLSDLELHFETTDASTSESQDGAVRILNDLGNVSFEWSNGSTGKDLTAVGSGQYTLTLTAEAGCQKSFEVEVLSTTGIEVSLTEIGYHIFPNPTNGKIQIESIENNRPDKLDLLITNLEGKIVGRYAKGDLSTLNAYLGQMFPRLSSGIYFIRLQSLEGFGIEKILKQ